MAVLPLVVDESFEGQRIDLGPLNLPGMTVTTGAPLPPPAAALGGTYWVDNTAAVGGDGTDELPFDSITDGIAAIAGLTPPVGTLLIAGEPDYSAEGLILVPDGITVGIFAWRAPAQEPVTFALSATGTPNIYLRGCEVEMTLGDAVVQTDMTSIVAVSSTGSSSLVMRGGSARLGGQLCRLTGAWDDAACSLMHVGASEAALDCVSLSCDACAVEGASLTAATLEFRTTSFSTAIALDATSISMDRQSEKSAALAGAQPTSLPVPLESTNPIYGSGDGGDVVQAASAVLAPATEYDNLTFVAGGQIRVETTPLRVRNLLSLAAAGVSAIVDYLGGAGGNAAANVGGAAWGGTGGATQGTTGTRNAEIGANGGGGAGAQPAATGTQNSTFGGRGGAGGAGGAGSGGAGGASVAAATVTNERVALHWPGPVLIGPSSATTNAATVVFASQPGQAGSAGGGSAAADLAGGGGGAGRGGGCVLVFARGIELSNATPAAAIDARGQAGGNGGKGAAAGAGGGGGAAGGGGGLVVIAYDWIIGTGGAADEVSASGGTGGTGGDAGGAGGTGGSGGGGGNGGQIILWNLLTNTRKVVTGAAGVAGAAGAGTVGGAGGAGGACSTDLP